MAALCSVLWLTCLYAAYSYVDPFGAKQAAARQSEAVLNRLFSGPGYTSEARDQITVVLLDDAFISQHRDQWPLSYNTQEWLLSSIARHQPRAIYLDFLYRQRHHKLEPIAQFQDALETTAEQVPLFIPLLVNAQQAPGSCVPPTRADAVAHARDVVDSNSVIEEVRRPGVQFAYIGWNGCGDRYPATLYRRAELPTPAFALLQAVCHDDPTFSSVCSSAGDPTKFEDPMHVVWGSGISENHRLAAQATGADCTYIDKSDRRDILSHQIRQIASAAGQIFTRSEERGISEACTYTDTLHGLWFDSFDPEVSRHIESLLKDRIVLVGAKVDGVPDLIVSPVNGQVPGVYLFAMALDNYLRYGVDYYRTATIEEGLLVEALILFCIAILLTVGWRWYAPRHLVAAGEILTLSDWSSLILRIAAWRFVLPLFLGLSLVLLFWRYGRLPLDWISLLAIAFFVSPVALNDCLEERPILAFWKSLRRRQAR